MCLGLKHPPSMTTNSDAQTPALMRAVGRTVLVDQGAPGSGPLLAPSLGWDTEEALQDLGPGANEVAALVASGAAVTATGSGLRSAVQSAT